MPSGLRRFQQTGDLHFLTFSCYRRLAYLGTAPARDLFESALERARKRSWTAFRRGNQLPKPFRYQERAGGSP